MKSFIYAISLAVAAGMFPFATRLALADQTPSVELQEIIVTGSHIKRLESEGSLPVQIITAAEIEKNGATTVEQLLQSVSVAVQGNNNAVASSGSGASTGGTSGISLRGLGTLRTLVLLNGRRLSGGGTLTDSSSVDTNTIPVAALDRVEVLKDGASAIYGSDAIAGVINFKLKDNFQGADVTVGGGGTADGGASNRRASATLGIGDLAVDRFNLLVVGSFQKSLPLFGKDREFASSSINSNSKNDTTSGNTFPANFAAADGSFGTKNPNAPADCAPSVLDPNYPPTRCRFDPAALVTLLPSQERYNVYSAAHYALTDSVQLYTEVGFNHNKQTFQIQPTPLSDQFALPANNVLVNQAPYNGFQTIILNSGSAFYPTDYVKGITGGPTPDLTIRYRSFLTGPRVLTNTSEQPRFVVGVKGAVSTWDYDVSALYNQTKLIEHDDGGYPILSKILPLLNSGQVNFFGDNTPAIQSAALATNFIGQAYETKSSLAGLSGSISGTIIDLPAGALASAFGVDFRREHFVLDPSTPLLSGDVAGYGGNFLPIDRARNVEAVYFELSAPILKSLEIDFAGRFENYSVVGNKAVPKISARWQPISQLLVRAAFSKGFRAPALTELYQPNIQGVTGNGQNDPARCNKTDNNGVVNTSSLDCGTQFPILAGGSTKLKPETSDNYTLGLVFEPIREVSLGLDFFKIKLTNPIIAGIDPTAILTNPALYGSLITRGAPDPGTPGLPGHIIQISQISSNLGETDINGVDVDFRGRVPTGELGHLSVSLVGTYFNLYKIQNPDGTFRSVNGQVSPITQGIGGAIPRWHHYLSLDWSNGPFDISIAQNFQSHYTDVPGTLEDSSVPGFLNRTVARYVTYDVSSSYSGIDRLRLSVGIKNLLNRNPPYTNASGQNFFQAGYDPGYGDPRGQFIYGSLTYSFGVIGKN